MGNIRIEQTVNAPLEVAFGYVDDYRNTPGYTEGLVSWEPVGDKTHGVGAAFTAVMALGGTKQSSTLEITSWRENELIGWSPLKGFKQSGTWRFAANGAKTDVVFDVDYEFPGGIAGKVLAKAIEPFVRANITKTVHNLRDKLEAL